MKYTVVWLPGPEAELLDLWIKAEDRKHVEQAANWIDKQLGNDPLKKLTPVDELYFLRRDPLVVLCEVNVDDRMVKIVEIHRNT
jgi:mRNA-degrading endonuclease RelE of RelBE toxin-antitoxin system